MAIDQRGQVTTTGILNILHSAYVIGSATLPAPQAHLMKVVVEGVFNKNLQWNFYTNIKTGLLNVCNWIKKNKIKF